MKQFVVDTILDEENICNLSKEKNILLQGILKGKKFVVYGRRNVGKTSLVKSVIIPAFRKSKKRSLVVFVDLLGVGQMQDVNQRLHLAFQHAFTEIFPARSFFKSITESIKHLRPTVSIDPIAGPAISLGVGDQGFLSAGQIGKELARLKHKYPVLLVLDEFQDIAQVDGAEGILRDVLQNLPNSLPVIILGSKKHLLSRIFAMPAAPLAGYGEDLEFPPISYQEYHSYMQERFEQIKLKISKENAIYLQNLAQRIPETINIVCAELYETSPSASEITEESINAAFDSAVEKRRSRYEEYLSRFSSGEQSLMATLAFLEPVDKPTGSSFVKKSRLSASGTQKVIKKLEDEAVVYNTIEGYRLADPLLKHFLRKYRGML